MCEVENSIYLMNRLLEAEEKMEEYLEVVTELKSKGG